MEIFDNIKNRLGDDLKQTIKKGSKISMAAACFSIYAFEELREELEEIEELRFIFSSSAFTKERAKKKDCDIYKARLDRERALYGTDFEMRLRNALTQKAIARECAKWIREKARFKSNITTHSLQGHIVVDDVGYTPLDCFSTVELGYEEGRKLNTAIIKDEALARQLLKDFDKIWEDEELLEDVTEEVLYHISSAYAENSPDFIYFFTLYNIFSEFLEGLSEDVIADEATGFRESAIWKKLYPFQKDAALSIINKLEKYNGCILADSVGLGKTYTALAVIKYYENRNKSVLVLCPKKISSNWKTFKENYKGNPLIADKLSYDVLYHTDLSRMKGLSNGIDLARLSWGNYDLVVIDESHNFRNGGRLLREEETDKENRYDRLLKKVIREGVKTKVLMLSASPVNNRFLDLKHQLALAYEGRSEIIDKKLRTKSSIDEIFARAQRAFNDWSKLDMEERRVDELLDRMDFDFFELLDSVTIARSRKHIQKYYDNSLIGPFSKRLNPLSLSPGLTDIKSAMSYKEIYKEIMDLHLSIYMPSHFIYPEKMRKYTDFMDYRGLSSGLNQLNREKGLRKLMSMNLLKRLESSVYSFKLTLGRMKKLIDDTIVRIEVIGRNSDMELDFKDLYDMEEYDSEDQRQEEDYSISSKYQIALEDLDYTKWKESLLHDAAILERLRLMVDNISPSHDLKLNTLYEVIDHKLEEPINEGNKKLLIFTAFADTAKYLYENVSSYVKEKHGLHSALVTGTIEGLTTSSKSKLDLNSVLSHFSPLSKEKALFLPDDKTEIDVLIATDCLSEGQNLQDCDYLINYDIHWNPVRIIQRFGRIDRIGSKNKYIQLVNFWPDVSLDEYIGLKSKVEAKMSIVNMTATGDEDILDRDEKMELEYRKNQLERLREEIVDLEEMKSSVSIMDLGLNDYRMDLLEYRKLYTNPERIPLGIHALTPAGSYASQGVIFLLKKRSMEEEGRGRNIIYPYYLVYIDKRGEVLLDHAQPRRILELMRIMCKDRTEAYSPLYTHFNIQTEDGRKMRHFSKLLNRSISSTMDVSNEEERVEMITAFDLSSIERALNFLDDFALISFLVIL